MKFYKGIITLIAAMVIMALFAGGVSQTDDSGAGSEQETIPEPITPGTAMPAYQRNT
jgi:hypothetical protein